MKQELNLKLGTTRVSKVTRFQQMFALIQFQNALKYKGYSIKHAQPNRIQVKVPSLLVQDANKI